MKNQLAVILIHLGQNLIYIFLSRIWEVLEVLSHSLIGSEPFFYNYVGYASYR